MQRKKLHKSTFVYLLLSICVVSLGIISYWILPDRFFFDAVIISEDFYNEKGFFRSYPVTMLFYEATGLGRMPFPVVALIQLPVLLVVLYRIGIPARFANFTLRNVLVYVCLLLLAFFISMPSKEFITFLFIAFIPFLLKNKRFRLITTVLLIFCGIILFGIWFRSYFILIPVVALVIYSTSLVNFKRKVFAGIFSGLLLVIFLSLSYGFVKGEYLSQSTREELNEVRAGEEATNSVIISPVSTENWYGEVVGVFYGFVSVNVPLNGFKHILKPQILAFVLWQTVLMLYLLYLYKNCLRYRNRYKYEIWAFYLVFAYFIVQGVFEPDLGSAVKHKIGILPLIYFALYYDCFRKNIPV
ncbi:hypothetical protein [Leeuwenhoekiella sp. W20_SRS_FM14]|uniref:hypothetical protein n=1 Tax=Leeuwenhoekiella sp. W20_SRS_FM14 TaxID=3240270 RepID=UPI003F9E269C